MKHVLCISPHFPPVNAADMHRLRQALSYFSQYGWRATVLAVKPEMCEVGLDAMLTQGLPQGLSVHFVNAFPTSITRKVALGNLGFRSWIQLRKAGNKLLENNDVDLIFFSTTVFTAIAHGTSWKRRYRVPFIVDLQDPWRNDYYFNLPYRQRPRKFIFDYCQKAILEAKTMPHADGILAVSSKYIEVVKKRYPLLSDRPSLVLPFSVLQSDRETAVGMPWQPKKTSQIVLRYVGRGGPDMKLAAEILFSALRQGRTDNPEVFRKLVFEFIGTSYAREGYGTKSIIPIAKEAGVEASVTEKTDRVSYFCALRHLIDADGLILLGSDDPAYTASKIYPYLLANRPLLAFLHSASPAHALLQKIQGIRVVSFDNNDKQELVRQTKRHLCWLAGSPPAPNPSSDVMTQIGAENMTRQLTGFFDTVVNTSRSYLSKHI